MYPAMFIVLALAVSVATALMAYKIRNLQETVEAMADSWASWRRVIAKEGQRRDTDVEELSRRLRDAEARARVAESYARDRLGSG